MLDDKNLSQLKQLKQQIEDQKEYGIGVVKATQRRFGFVVLDDGREIFLAPEEMDKVFPGDKIKVLITTEQIPASRNGKKNAPKAKKSAQVMQLLATPLADFTGRYAVKGKGHFVEPDLADLNRWIFIPPAQRNGAKNGDFIRCKISKHPYPQAKPQAHILEVIGSFDKPGIEADYVVSKFQLDPGWPDNWRESLSEIDLANREDLTDKAFVTIDSASTTDMDDALFAKVAEDGWELSVAIADPCALITGKSQLEQLIQARGSSVYLPGKAIPMLPSELSSELCSLQANQTRPAIVCKMHIRKDGTVSDYQLSEAVIRSHGKLSYNDVSNYLAAANENLHDCHGNGEVLQALEQLTAALHESRKEKNLVQKDREYFRILLNHKRKIDSICVAAKNSAQALVEECMIAANRSVSDWLGDEAVFINHGGFRKERINDVKKLASEQLGLDDIDPTSVDGFKQLMNSIDDDAIEFPLRSVLSRLLKRSRLHRQSNPHFGMGLSSYTTFTSPIRKFSDFLVHRLIKQKLRGESITAPDQDLLDTLQQKLDITRQAKNQMEQVLKCQFMLPLVNKTFSGRISQINSNGFTVRLDENHIEGFVETRLLPDKYSFDPMRLRLSSKTLTIELDQAIQIVVSGVESDKRSIRFTLPAAS